MLRDELRPVVREALTENVLDGIRDLIGHVPAAVAAAADLLDSTDEETRYKAAALILRHTTGNKAIVPDVNADKQQDLNVFFNLPRPEVEAGTVSGVIEEKECDSCHTSKPLDEFVGSSDRCQVCFDSMRKAVHQLTNATSPE